jgi:integrase/recombinase XerC
LPKAPNENQATATLEGLRDNEKEGWIAARDHAIALLLYGSGLRISEALGLTVADVKQTQGSIRVRGKGNKERIIPFNEKMNSIISDYLILRNQIATVNNLLVSDKGKKLSESFVYKKVKHYLSLVTTIEKKSPHVLRHTFATHLTNQGAELNAIKELLGHTSLAATQVYTHNNIQKLKDIYKLSHPKA